MGVLSASYLTVDGEILSETRSGVDTDYLTDPLGSVAGLIDSTQAIFATQGYWPYGEVQTSVGLWNGTPFGFIGSMGYYTELPSATYVRARL